MFHVKHGSPACFDASSSVSATRSRLREGPLRRFHVKRTLHLPTASPKQLRQLVRANE